MLTAENALTDARMWRNQLVPQILGSKGEGVTLHCEDNSESLHSDANNVSR